jgi:hypothetical protein
VINSPMTRITTMISISVNPPVLRDISDISRRDC